MQIICKHKKLIILFVSLFIIEGLATCGNGRIGICPNPSDCCSRFGYCGTLSPFCAPSNGCKSNCWSNNFGPRPVTTTTSTTSAISTRTSTTSTTRTTSSSTSSSNITTRAVTVVQFDPNTPICGGGKIGICPDGRCCSMYGYCGLSSQYCAPSFGCRSNCWSENSGGSSNGIVSTTSFSFSSSASSTTTRTTTTRPASTYIPSAPIYDSNPEENPWFDPRGFYSSCNTKGTFALTFDDGPSEFTGDLLDTLKAANVKATFFVVGNMIDSSPTYANHLYRAYNEGHLIGSHGYSHTDLMQLSKSEIVAEMKRASDSIFRVIGVHPRLMRPPYGSVDDRVIEILTKDLSYRIINWNYDTFDWQDLNTNTLISKTKDILEKYRNSFRTKSFIALMHDIIKTTVDAQATLIDLVKNSNYKLMRLDECLQEVSYA